MMKFFTPQHSINILLVLVIAVLFFSWVGINRGNSVFRDVGWATSKS
jgi:hypothetical protein